MITWAFVMYLFELDKSILNQSMISSMDFIYRDSDQDFNSWRELIPFEIPFI